MTPYVLPGSERDFDALDSADFFNEIMGDVFDKIVGLQNDDERPWDRMAEEISQAVLAKLRQEEGGD